MSVYSPFEVYPSSFDDVCESVEDVLYQKYLTLHSSEMGEEEVREMYDEYYSCYEEWYL